MSVLLYVEEALLNEMLTLSFINAVQSQRELNVTYRISGDNSVAYEALWGVLEGAKISCGLFPGRTSGIII